MLHVPEAEAETEAAQRLLKAKSTSDTFYIFIATRINYSPAGVWKFINDLANAFPRGCRHTR